MFFLVKNSKRLWRGYREDGEGVLIRCLESCCRNVRLEIGAVNNGVDFRGSETVVAFQPLSRTLSTHITRLQINNPPRDSWIGSIQSILGVSLNFSFGSVKILWPTVRWSPFAMLFNCATRDTPDTPHQRDVPLAAVLQTDETICWCLAVIA